MSGRTFVDTNVLIYAHDIQAGRKQEKAARILGDLWETRTGVLSTQVLQEFYVNVTRKIPSPLKRSTARDIIRQYSVWPVVGPDTDMIVRASELEESHQLSFWDAMIVAAARQAGAGKILTEDLNHGETVDGVAIENPFAEG
jgi:predicted nucleic acid-binding protein